VAHCGLASVGAGKDVHPSAHIPYIISKRAVGAADSHAETHAGRQASLGISNSISATFGIAAGLRVVELPRDVWVAWAPVGSIIA